MWKIVLFFPLFLYAKEYYLSFQYTYLNGKIINFNLNYSKVMVHSNLKTIKTFKYFNQHQKLKNIFFYEAENIIDLLSKNRVIVYDNSILHNLHNNEKIKITYPPQIFDIIFKDGYMIFKLKE